MDKKVSIILVNYNGAKDTLECINSLRNIEFRNFEIIVVDNNSIQEEKKLLKENNDGFILLESNENDGFAIGNNIGIEYAINNNADYVLLLNNDTIVEKDFLNIMLDTYILEENIGAVGCKIMYNDNKDLIWYKGGKIDYSKFSAFNMYEKQNDINENNEVLETDFITGCCVLLSKKTIKAVGDLSDEYFMYYEDVDYSLRVKEAGFKIVVNPRAKIYHKVSVSSGGEDSPFRIYYSNRARRLFMNKFKYKVSKVTFIKAKLYFIATRLLKIAAFILRKEKVKARALFNAINNKDY